MNKHNLMRKIASVATELDYAGLTKEAKTMDSILLKLASGPEDENYGDPNLKSDMSDEEYFSMLEGIAEEMENSRKNPNSESSDNWGEPQQENKDDFNNG
jgi:hypothetical protein